MTGCLEYGTKELKDGVGVGGGVFVSVVLNSGSKFGFDLAGR
jgi:hypothetical protein